MEALVDFALTAGGYFVMVTLDVQAALFHGLHHLAAQILIMVGRRNWKVAFLVARTVAQVVLLAARVPAALFGIDEIEPRMLVLIQTYVAKNKKLGFCPEIRRVAHTPVLQIYLGLLGDHPR